ncbi:MAG: hypothetical protein QXM20_01865 [Fervidicoccaceae archaeon]
MRQFLALILIFTTITTIPIEGTSQQGNITYYYALLIYPETGSFSTGSSLANITVILKQSPSPHVELQGAFPSIPTSDLVSIIEAPDPSHFVLTTQDVSQLVRTGKLIKNEWNLTYAGRSAFQLSNGAFVDGIQATITFNYGSKIAMYDSSSGVLVWESFYVSISPTKGYALFLELLPSSSIYGAPLPINNLRVVEIISAIIVITAFYSLASRKRYRIL